MTIICITGASSGIGRACAERFAADPACRFILLARRAERLTDLEHELGADRCLAAQLDVRDRAAVAAFFQGLPAEWQAIDVLINNAGLAAGKDTAQQASLDDWDQMVQTNVQGVLYVSREVLPGMVARRRGHLFMIGSIAGHDPYPGGSVYCGTKAFVRQLSRALKMDLLGTPVRVSCIDPGLVETEFSVVRFKGDAGAAATVYQDLTPLTAADVADVVHFCATRPAHVNISEVLLLPTDQGGASHVYRHTR